MKLSEKEIVALAHGYIEYEITDKGLVFYKYTKRQRDYFKGWNEFFYRSTHSTNSVIIKFETDSSFVEFSICSDKYSGATIDVYQDNVMTSSFRATDDGVESRTFYCELKKGVKTVSIYLPSGMQSIITSMVIEDNSYAKPVTRDGKKVLFLGDSISQGYGCEYTSLTYVNILTSLGGFNTLNQGLGGFTFDENFVDDLDDFKPNIVISEFGTNGYLKEEFKESAIKYHKRLDELYSDIPIVAITPIWRADMHEEEFYEASKFLKDLFLQYKNIRTIDGMNLTPHLRSFHFDPVHPNSLCASYFAMSLYKQIKDLI